jgi:hypothetical protein
MVLDRLTKALRDGVATGFVVGMTRRYDYLQNVAFYLGAQLRGWGDDGEVDAYNITPDADQRGEWIRVRLANGKTTTFGVRRMFSVNEDGLHTIYLTYTFPDGKMFFRVGYDLNEDP